MNGYDLAIARHESLHVVTAVWLSWPVSAVARMHTPGRDGQTFLGAPPEGDAREIALKRCLILVMPALDNAPGVETDLDEADMLVRLADLRLSEVWNEAASLLREPEYRRAVRDVESELYSRPLMSGAEVKELVWSRT